MSIHAASSSPDETKAPVHQSVLIVDLDGTLTPVDTLVESALLLVRRSPANLIRMMMWLAQGKAKLKEEISKRVELQVDLLPYRQAFIEYLQAQKAGGRRIVLATAANSRIATRISEHLGLFDEVLASDDQTNLKGVRKLEAIAQRVGPDFVYAGDSRADLPIWEQARGAILVGAPRAVARAVNKDTHVEAEFVGVTTKLSVWLRAVRVHQWVKNVLLFVPLLTAFSFFQIQNVFLLLVAFASFSMLASATYILNDLWDLNSDRNHARKRSRPFASGAISPIQGLLASGVLFASAAILACCISANFACALLTYLVLTSSYSLLLKTYVLMDILMLSCLYTLRIIAGALAIDVAVSNWLLAFSGFLFLSLALVKRCAELVALEESGAVYTKGRDYRVSDLKVLWPFGVASSVASVVVFGLFVSSPETSQRYLTPHLLWLVAAALVYWLGRLWIKTSRGEMHDDPVVYAIKDRPSFIVGTCVVVCMFAARFCELKIPFLLQ